MSFGFLLLSDLVPKGVISGVVGNFLLWERWYGIPYRYRGGGGCLNEWSFVKSKNPGSNIGVYFLRYWGDIVIHPACIVVRYI